ncbi:sulfite exporter TauE/SafE family protein [Cytophagaceae bacterium ABcell3]|nr:sulfite exporter TauE/SafE family protein [Cytophagaceae bacterium ABcell3]
MSIDSFFCGFCRIGLGCFNVGKVFYLAGYQQVLSILLGVLVIAAVLYPSLVKGKINVIGFGLVNSIKRGLTRVFNNGSYPGLMFTGILNGFLPCGLVYMALAGSMATGGMISGSLFMAAFGLGTLPVMMAVSLGGAFASESIKSKIRKAVPAMMVVMGLVLILRGLNLGIPYVSPAVGAEGQEVHSCH